MSIAARAQKLLRIVFRTYMCFPVFQIQKKCGMGIAASKQNALRIRFLSPVQSPGQREQRRALLHL